MTWGITIGIILVMGLFAFIGFIVFKEARTHRFWQAKVEEGDLDMITQLVQAEVERWRTERPPKGMPATVWQGIQAVEVIEIAADYLHVSSTAEPQFALVAGQRRQVSSAVDEAKRITAKLAERLFYDIPHIRPDRVQIDVYTTFHQPDGVAAQACVLSVLAERSVAAAADWDNDPPEVIAEQLGVQYRLDERGLPQPIEPGSLRVSTNGHGTESTA